MKIRRELHCRECGNWLQFEIDDDLDGNHVFDCPKCGHHHCRVVRNGEITDFRWDRRNGVTHTVRILGTSSASLWDSSTGFLRDSWANSDSTDMGYW